MEDLTQEERDACFDAINSGIESYENFGVASADLRSRWHSKLERIERQASSGSDLRDRIEQLRTAATACSSKSDQCARDGKQTMESVEMLLEQWKSSVDNDESGTLRQVKRLQSASAYTDRLVRIERLRVELTTRVGDPSFDVLADLAKTCLPLADSSCVNIRTFAIRSWVFAWRHLLERVLVDFDKCLSVINYPSWGAEWEMPRSGESRSKSWRSFEIAIGQLARMEVARRRGLAVSGKHRRPFSISLPVRILLRPLEKRFIYNFRDAKKITNQLDRPEYFFNQVAQWITNHMRLMDTAVEPVCRHRAELDVDVKREFASGCVALINEKLREDWPAYQEDEAAFLHLVDELLFFGSSLRYQFAELHFTPSSVGCVDFLVEPDSFQWWSRLAYEHSKQHIRNALLEEKLFPAALDAPALSAAVSSWQRPAAPLIVAKLLAVTADRLSVLPVVECQWKLFTLMMDALQFCRDLLCTRRHDLLYKWHSDSSNSAAHDALGVCRRILVLHETARLVRESFVELCDTNIGLAGLLASVGGGAETAGAEQLPQQIASQLPQLAQRCTFERSEYAELESTLLGDAIDVAAFVMGTALDAYFGCLYLLPAISEVSVAPSGEIRELIAVNKCYTSALRSGLLADRLIGAWAIDELAGRFDLAFVETLTRVDFRPESIPRFLSDVDAMLDCLPPFIQNGSTVNGGSSTTGSGDVTLPLVRACSALLRLPAAQAILLYETAKEHAGDSEMYIDVLRTSLEQLGLAHDVTPAQLISILEKRSDLKY